MANFLFGIPIFVVATLWLSFLTYLAPSVPESEENPLKFPTSFDDVFKLSKLFKSYHETNRIYMLGLFISAYLYKQAFSIPGSALLNILGGNIFGFWTSLPLCCILTGIGATLSYTMSKVFAADLVTRIWPNEVDKIRTKIINRDNMFYYWLSLRLMPFTPNWLLNLISPIVGVPLHLFFITVFIGLIPYNYVCVQAGAMISNISSLNDVFTWTVFLQLGVMAIAVFELPFFVEKIAGR